MTGSRTLFIGPANAPDLYELTSVIDGTGGEGKVWRGYANFNEPRPVVAVKVYHPEHLTSRDAGASLLRLQETASRLRSLRHPGLAGVHEPFLGAPPHPANQPDASVPFVLCMPMDFIAGDTFESWCSTTASRVARLSMLSNAADALGQMHARQVVHGDIKPANIIVESAEARSVLVDYGLVRVAAADHPAARKTVMGTPGYWAPEVATAGRYSPSSDLYALACTIVFAVSGEHPPPSSPPETVVVWAHDRLTRSGMSSTGIARVTQALAPSPANRDAAMTPVGLLQAIRQSASTTASQSVHTFAPPVPPPKRRRYRALSALALGAAIIAAAVYVPAYLDARKGSESETVSTEPGLVTSTQTTPTTSTLSTTATTISETTLPATTLPETTVAPTAPPPTLPPTVSLSTLDVVTSSGYSFDPATMNGIPYTNVVRQDVSVMGHVSKVEYNLEAKYSTFTATVGFIDTYSNPYNWEFRLTAIDNGAEVVLAQAFLGPGQTQALSANVSEVRRFVISVRLAEETFLPSGTPNYPAVWADPTLTR